MLVNNFFKRPSSCITSERAFYMKFLKNIWYAILFIPMLIQLMLDGRKQDNESFWNPHDWKGMGK